MFIGVVKDINDPLNANRVRVRIYGIHPEGDDDMPLTGSVSGPGAGGGSGTSTTGGSSGTSGASGPTNSPIKVDESNLPDSRKLGDKISKNFTLENLTTGASGPASKSSSRRGINQGLLTKEIIKNLANLATNVLDPLKDKYPNLNINSGWRIGYSKADGPGTTGNHSSGRAADVSAPGVSPREMASWIQSNLRGRYSTILIYPTFIHVQFESTPGRRQGTTSSPLVR